MKPFDLEAAKRGEPIICRDGTPAKFIAYVPELDSDRQVLCLVENVVRGYSISGEWIHPQPQGFLFMAPRKRTVWINLHQSGHYDARDTEAAADDVAYTTFGERIGGKAYPIEIEE